MKATTAVIALAVFFSSHTSLCAGKDNPRQIFESAVQALNARDYMRAEKGFHRVLELDPRNVSALANLGILYAQTHRYTEAIEADKKALSISPQQKETEFNLGLAYLKEEDYDHASTHFQQLHERDPANQRITMLLATCLAFGGHPDSSIGLLKPLVEAPDHDPAALYLLGVAYSRAGQAQQAEDVFTELFANSATPAQANFLLGKAYAEATNFQKAQQAFQAVVKADPAFPGAHREFGKAYLGQNQYAPAQAELLQAIVDDPEDGSACYYLGAVLVQSGRYREGLPYLKKASSLMPDSWATYFYMGKAELQLKDIAAAVPFLRQAAEMNPDDSGAFYLLSRAFRSEGRIQDANTAMQHVIALHTTLLDAEKRALKERGIVGEQAR